MFTIRCASANKIIKTREFKLDWKSDRSRCMTKCWIDLGKKHGPRLVGPRTSNQKTETNRDTEPRDCVVAQAR